MTVQAVFHLRDVTKLWEAPGEAFELAVPQLEIPAGAQIALLGRSGCGKSTLLDILAMTLEPTACGHFCFEPKAGRGTDVRAAWKRRRLALLAGVRGRQIGYVLQTGGLLPFVSVRENIELPRRLCGLPENDTAAALAARLQIDDQLDKLPETLSVGQRQRVAVARALAHTPAVVLADEPTASLDPHTAAEVMGLLVELCAERASTLVLATHDWEGVDSLGFTKLQHRQIDEAGVLRSEFFN